MHILLLLLLLPLNTLSRDAESPLCPDSPDRDSGGSSSFRFHKETRRCYEAGEKGPCPPLMRFYAEDATFGTCDCDHTLRCGRPLLYWKANRRCYFAHDQGPCREGKWVVFGFDLQPVCKKNLCVREEEREGSVGGKYWVTTSPNQTCHRTGTQGPCASPREKLVNLDLHFRPTCQTQPHCGAYPHLRNLPCFPGQKMDVEGRCERRMMLPSGAEGVKKKGPRLPPTAPPTNVYCLFCNTRTDLRTKLPQ